MNRIDAFIDEIRTSPKFAAAAEREPHWLDDLDAFERALDAMFRSDLAVVVQASDRIAALVGDTSIPLKARLLAVKSAMSEVVRKDG
jgi:hypothetical protein